jgi:hypothetical protein
MRQNKDRPSLELKRPEQGQYGSQLVDHLIGKDDRETLNKDSRASRNLLQSPEKLDRAAKPACKQAQSVKAGNAPMFPAHEDILT